MKAPSFRQGTSIQLNGACSSLQKIQCQIQVCGDICEEQAAHHRRGLGLRCRVPAQVLHADIDAFPALKVIVDYKPANPDDTLSVVTEKYDILHAIREAENHAHSALAAAIAVQWAFDDVILDVKNQAKAQFGPDSDQVAALGLKKKSERKSRSRGSKPAT